MLDALGCTRMTTGSATGTLNKEGRRARSAGSRGLTRLANTSREFELRPTAFSKVIVRSMPMPPGSCIAPVTVFPETVIGTWIVTSVGGRVTGGRTWAEAGDAAAQIASTPIATIARMNPPRLSSRGKQEAGRHHAEGGPGAPSRVGAALIPPSGVTGGGRDAMARSVVDDPLVERRDPEWDGYGSPTPTAAGSGDRPGARGSARPRGC